MLTRHCLNSPSWLKQAVTRYALGAPKGARTQRAFIIIIITVGTGTSELLVARGLQSCGTIRAYAVHHCATVITCLHACRLECVVQSAAACNCLRAFLGPRKRAPVKISEK